MSESSHPHEWGVLLHGLARSKHSMTALANALQRAGYRVINHAYPSRRHSVEALAGQVIPAVLRQCREQGAQTIHFVTHSLGGILLREYCREHDIAELGRVVMLGPPNQGSEAVDRLRDLPGFYLLNGPAGRQLGTAEDGLPRQLGAVGFELGVIAGSRSINPLLSWLIPGPDDGKVSIAATRVEGMRDFITLPCSHTFMMRHPGVIRQTLYFLEHGSFNRNARGEPKI